MGTTAGSLPGSASAVSASAISGSAGASDTLLDGMVKKLTELDPTDNIAVAVVRKSIGKNTLFA